MIDVKHKLAEMIGQSDYRGLYGASILSTLGANVAEWMGANWYLVATFTCTAVVPLWLSVLKARQEMRHREDLHQIELKKLERELDLDNEDNA